MLFYKDSKARVTNNELYVTYMCQCMADDVLTVLTNGGSQVFNKVSMLSLLPLHAHVNNYIMAMIISLYCASDIPVVRVTLDTSRVK